MKALLRKELSAYFGTPAAYIVSIVFLLITGYFFGQPLFVINQATLRGFTDLAPLLWCFVVPAVTMRLFAEEFKTGTIELLSTMPIEEWRVVLAKYAAALALLGATLLLTFPYPLALAALGRVDWGGVAGAYLGLWLSAAVLAAAGLFASTLTRNQIIAFILAFLIAFAFYLMGKLQSLAPIWAAPALGWFGLDSHLDSLERGVFDTRDFLYYLSVSGFFLLAATVSLRSRRWR